jgi:hypothetical protein
MTHAVTLLGLRLPLLHPSFFAVFAAVVALLTGAGLG